MPPQKKQNNKAPSSKSSKKSKGKKIARPVPAPVQLPQTRVVDKLMDVPIQTTEIISCTLNPYAITQALYGFFGAHMAHFDSPDAQQALHNMVYFCATSFKSPETCGVDFLPEFVIRMMSSVRPRRVGSVLLMPDFSALDFLYQNFTSNQGDFTGTTVQSVGVPSTYDAYGFANALLTSYLIPSPTLMQTFLMNYLPGVPMLSILKLDIVPANDFSGFAFDLSNPVSSTGVAYDQGTYWQCSSTATKTSGLYLPECSSVGCEGPMRTRWIAALRMCTPVQYTAGATELYHAFPRRAGNGSGCVLQVNMTPSVAGHFFALRKGKVPSVAQIKVVPTSTAIKDIVLRFEAAINSLTASDGATNNVRTSWRATFSASEVQIMAYGIWMSSVMRNAWCTMGCAWANSSSFQAYGIPGMHSYYKIWETVQVPQIMASLLGATQVWDDHFGVLIPGFIGNQIPSSYPGAYAYSGSTSYTIPTNILYHQFFKNSVAIMKKYRAYESALAQACTMVPVVKLGPSLLDASMTRADPMAAGESTRTIGIFARRPVSQARVAAIVNAVSFVSYDTQYSGNGYSTGSNNRMKLYRQGYYEPLSTNEAITDLIALSMYQGLVNPGTMSGQNLGPNEVPDPWYWRVLKGATPKYGNYGGPGYTAGQDVTDGSNPPMMYQGGRMVYSLPPIDEEDALYKQHDEDYYYAAKGVGSRSDADARLFDGLRIISGIRPLSSYGKAAREVFRPASKNSLFPTDV